MKFAARLLFFFLFFSSFLFATATLTHAQTSVKYNQPNTNSDVPHNLHTYTQSALIEIFSAVSCQIGGVDVMSPGEKCLVVDPVTKKIGFATSGNQMAGGAIGTMGNLIGMTYNMPLNTGVYVKDVASNFGIVHKTYAATTTTGFDNLSQVLEMWKKMRDLSYLGFVIIFVIIGFAIMLRVKIDPRTVMSIQNQIPKIVICIILITFSYAIASLMVDFMWVSTYAGINVLAGDVVCQDNSKNTEDLAGNVPANIHLTAVSTKNLLENPLVYVHELLSSSGCLGNWDGITGLSKNVGSTVGDIASRSIFSIFGINAAPPPECHFWQVDCKGTRIVYEFISVIITGIAMLIVFIALLFALFRVWFALIKSFVNILLYVVFAPFIILAGLWPGSTMGFAYWFKHLFARLAVFPMTVFMFVGARIFATAGGAINDTSSHPFTPPLIGNPNLADNFGWLTAVGIIFIAPEAINILNDALKTQPSKYTGALFNSISAGTSTAQKTVAPFAKSLFGKNKDGGWGPLTYYPLRSLGFAGGESHQNRLTKWWKGLEVNKPINRPYRRYGNTQTEEAAQQGTTSSPATTGGTPPVTPPTTPPTP